eukprot:g80254.t1
MEEAMKEEYNKMTEEQLREALSRKNLYNGFSNKGEMIDALIYHDKDVEQQAAQARKRRKVEPTTTATRTGEEVEVSQKTLFDNLKFIKEAVECKSCFESLTPPIMQCENGHCTCNKCMKDLKRCPHCRVSFAKTTHNLKVEEILNNFRVNCRHPDCTQEVRFQDKGNHEKECLWRPIPCPYKTPCDYQGDKIEDLVNHLKTKHKKDIKLYKERFSLTLSRKGSTMSDPSYQFYFQLPNPEAPRPCRTYLLNIATHPEAKSLLTFQIYQIHQGEPREEKIHFTLGKAGSCYAMARVPTSIRHFPSLEDALVVPVKAAFKYGAPDKTDSSTNSSKLAIIIDPT